MSGVRGLLPCTCCYSPAACTVWSADCVVARSSYYVVGGYVVCSLAAANLSNGSSSMGCHIWQSSSESVSMPVVRPPLWSVVWQVAAGSHIRSSPKWWVATFRAVWLLCGSRTVVHSVIGCVGADQRLGTPGLTAHLV